jgi:hypothetical protein
MKHIPESQVQAVLDSLPYADACALLVLRAHARHDHNATKTADALECSRGTVYRALAQERSIMARVAQVLAQLEPDPAPAPAPAPAPIPDSTQLLVPLVQELIRALREATERDA